MAAGSGAVVGERGERMEPERLLPGGSGFLLLGVREHDRGIEVHRDQAPVRARRALASQRPGAPAGGSAGLADRPQRPRRIGGQRADQPGDHRIRSHRSAQARHGPQHRDISQAVPAQPQRHGQVGNDLPRVMHRPRRPPPGQTGAQTLAQARHPERFGQQQPASLRHQPVPVGRHGDLGAEPGILHLESAFGLAWTGS